MMPRNLLRTSLIICSAFLLTGCPEGPKVTAYISDPSNGGLRGFDSKSGKPTGLVPYSKTENFVCFDPPDAQSLLNYCKHK